MTVGGFVWPVRIYYEDTDAGGVAYHANFLKFMERARTEWLRSVGFEQDALLAAGLLFVVRSVSLEFVRPGRVNQALEVSAVPSRRGHASLTFEQQVRLAGGGEALCTARVKIACVDAATFRPRPIPAELRAEIHREL